MFYLSTFVSIKQKYTAETRHVSITETQSKYWTSARVDWTQSHNILGLAENMTGLLFYTYVI